MWNILLLKWKKILEESYKLIFIVGPTATGKSSLAFELARKYQGVILNGDSVQTYKGLDVGTAKPTKEEFQMVQHELFDIVSPPQRLTAGEYFPRARKALSECLKHNHVFVVGGSGFYIQALEKGMFPVGSSSPEIVERYQKVLNEKGAVELHSLLSSRDPDYAAQIPESDSYRVLRALVLTEMEGKTMAEIQSEFEKKQESSRLKIPLLKVGLTMDREILRDRVTQRVEDMVARGLRAEVEGLLAQGLADWHPLSSVGYLETVAFIKGELNERQWKDKIITSTMQLAKRQMTWFKRDESLEWFRMPDERPVVFERIENYLSDGK